MFDGRLDEKQECPSKFCGPAMLYNAAGFLPQLLALGFGENKRQHDCVFDAQRKRFQSTRVPQKLLWSNSM